MTRLLDPQLNTWSPRHAELARRYQALRTVVDFGAAICFVAGSALFFSAATTRAADWLFLVGSVLFAMKPTIDVIRSLHLARLPGWTTPGVAASP